MQIYSNMNKTPKKGELKNAIITLIDVRENIQKYC